MDTFVMELMRRGDLLPVIAIVGGGEGVEKPGTRTGLMVGGSIDRTRPRSAAYDTTVAPAARR